MTKVKKKYIATFIVAIALLELIFGLTLKPPVIEVLQINGFLVIVIVGFLLAAVRQRKTGIITGYSFFLTLWTVWLVFAWIGKYYFIINDIWKSRNSAIYFDKYFSLSLIAVLCFTIAYHIGLTLPKMRLGKNKHVKLGSKNQNGVANLDLVKINKYLSVVSIVCILLDIFFYVRMGGFTMLYRGNIDEYRFDVQDESALFNYVNYMIPILMILKISVIREGKIKNINNYFIIGFMFLMEFVYGSKMLFIFPIVVSFCLAYMDQKKDFINIRNIILLAVATLVCIVYTNYRGLGQAVSNSILSDLFLFVGGEFRDATRYVTFVDSNNIYINTLGTAILKCIPHGIRAVFDADQYIENIGYNVKTSLGYSFAGGSTRIGILAEMYTFGRLTAVIVCFALLGFIISRIDKRITENDDIWKKTFRMIYIFQLSWFLLAETYIQLPAMIIYMLLYAIIRVTYKIVYKRIKA